MQCSIVVHQHLALEWGLNFPQAALLNYFVYGLKTDPVKIGGQFYYPLSYQELIRALPLMTTKPDTMKRHIKALIDAGLIERKHVGKRPFIRMTDKSKRWVFGGSK